jgi:hypothetical protein
MGCQGCDGLGELGLYLTLGVLTAAFLILACLVQQLGGESEEGNRWLTLYLGGTLHRADRTATELGVTHRQGDRVQRVYPNLGNWGETERTERTQGLVVHGLGLVVIRLADKGWVELWLIKPQKDVRTRGCLHH